MPVDSGGATETTPPSPGRRVRAVVPRPGAHPRVRVRALRAPVALIRLDYATDLRYGVLVDIATAVVGGEPIDLVSGYVNTIWQGDANAALLQALRRARARRPSST